jgi:peptidoglycan/xylan/chitin deacetylase (PgdA/CDA1 family)
MDSVLNSVRVMCAGMGRAIDIAGLAVLASVPATRIFVFHAIEEPHRIIGFNSGVPFHTPSVFQDFVRWLAPRAEVIESGASCHKGAISGPNRRNRAVLTFDDGFLDHYTNVFPLLQDYGMTCTFFVCTGLVGRPGGLTRSMIREMSDHGMTIGSHSVSHLRLPQYKREQVRQEMVASRSYLEDLTGRGCDEIAYPYGAYNEMVFEEAARAGYKLGFASSPYATGDNRFAIPRIGIPVQTDATAYAIALYDAARWRRVVGQIEVLDRFVHGTIGYNHERFGVPREFR